MSTLPDSPSIALRHILVHEQYLAKFLNRNKRVLGGSRDDGGERIDDEEWMDNAGKVVAVENDLNEAEADETVLNDRLAGVAGGSEARLIIPQPEHEVRRGSCEGCSGRTDLVIDARNAATEAILITVGGCQVKL